MPPTLVSTPAALLAALKTATAGTVILLAPGRWEAVLIRDVNAAPGVVTVRSQDANNPAIIAKLAIAQSDGVTLSDVTLASELYNPPTGHGAPTPWVVAHSNNVTLDNVQVHGTLDNNPQNDVNGLSIGASSKVVVKNSTFQQLFNGILEGNNTDIVISNNVFHDIRCDGIDNSGTSNVTITGNSFTDFYPVGEVGTTGDHADAIQFWTSGTKTPAHDIEIANNTYVRGTGAAIQGIFVTDQVGQTYQHVTIRDNHIEGASYNGITAANCSGLTITGNTVQPYSDVQSWIRVQKCSDVQMTGNHAGTYFLKLNDHMSQSHNETVDSQRAPKKFEQVGKPHS